MGTILSFDAARSLGRPSNIIVFRKPGLIPLGTFGQLFDDDGLPLCMGWIHQHGRDNRITVLAQAGYCIDGDADNFRADDAPSGGSAA